MNMSLKGMLKFVVAVAFLFSAGTSAMAQVVVDQPAIEISCGTTDAPQPAALVRVKGDVIPWRFTIAPVGAEISFEDIQWAFNEKVPGAAETLAYGTFEGGGTTKSLTWKPKVDSPTGVVTIAVKFNRVCGSPTIPPAPGSVKEFILTWNISIFTVEIKRDIAGGAEQFNSISNANRNILPGQKMILRADVQGLPEGVTPSYVWETLPGTVFEDWTADQDRATLTEIYPDDLDQQNINFYWADTGDGRKVQVSVTVNAKTVDAEATFNIKLPTSTFKVTQLGASRLNAAGDTLGLYGVPAGNAGIVWMGKVSTPTGFTEGQINFVQLTKAYTRKVGTNGEVYHAYDDGILDLDTRYPGFPPPFTSHPGTGTAGSWPADGGEHYESDGPYLGLEADAQAYNVRLDLKTYLMFLPHGEDSRYVPLRMFTWAYGAIVNREAAGWVRQEGSAIQESNPLTEQQAPEESKHPTWFVRFNPDIFTWNKGSVAVNIIATRVNEGAGTVSGQASVTVLENVAAPLIVNLSAADVTVAIVPAGGEKILVPATVTIPANSKSVQFSFTVTNNDTKDPTQIVRITASATGYTPTEDTVAVLDND